MKRILIVEDELELGVLMVALLRSAGHHPTYASDAEKAKNFLKGEQFDKVILDIFLGKSNGMSLIPTVNALQEMADIIIVSAFADSIPVKDLYAQGITKIIKKPFSKAQLLKAVS